MANPFQKRATEYLRDDEAFLSIVIPEPLRTYFSRHAKNETLYDQLTLIVGTPGSGKTTLARLFQFSTLTTLLANTEAVGRKPLIDALTECGAIVSLKPKVLGARIPLESEYREFWEFPYEADLRIGLMTTLLQARTVLVWLRNIQNAGIPLDAVSIIPRSDANASLDSIGGVDGEGLLKRAQDIERSLYKISAALIPPHEDQIEENALTAYRPFDVIELVQLVSDDNTLVLRPLAIFDDAHSLHPRQFESMLNWLRRREIRVSRWIQTRLDSLDPMDVLRPEKLDTGEKISREFTIIRLQGDHRRADQRRMFRKMARDMTGRYLELMEVFSQRQIHQLSDMLSNEEPTLPASKLKALQSSVDTTQEACNVSTDRRKKFEDEVGIYLAKKPLLNSAEDLRLGMVRILMNRYAKRVPQRSLFDEDTYNREPKRPLLADDGVLDGARIHLLHQFDRPYYFGMNTLCDSASDNAEQLLQLSAAFVDQLEAECIRRRRAMLGASVQHRLLRAQAEKIISEWDFPRHHEVLAICEGIATKCREKSLEPNASLKGGAAAIAILMDEFRTIPASYPAVARSLKFGVAYNAFSIVPDIRAKGTIWCLIDLGGAYRMKTGLTLRYGGFMECSLGDLLTLHGEGF